MSTDSHRPPTGADDGFQAVDAGAQATRSRTDYPVKGAPSDNTTLISVLTSLEEQGVTSEVSATRRLEGASDPDDMLTVIGARCPRCARAGALILGYGPNASEEDAAISVELGSHRS